MSRKRSGNAGSNGPVSCVQAKPVRQSRPLFLVALAILSLVGPTGAVSQEVTEDEALLLRSVMPAADSFSEKRGQPPVFRAFGEDPESGERTLLGYVFLTSDLPPEERGYSGPIEVLVGVDLQGTLTGVRVTRYRESIQSIYGDFLRIPGFQEQFAGKHIADPFRVYRDVAGISRATITVAAMSRGIRNAARRVVQAYPLRPEVAAPSDPPSSARSSRLEDFGRLSWPEMVAGGLVGQIVVSSRGLVRLELSFAYIGVEAVGRILLGPSLFDEVRQEAEARARDDHVMLLGLDGPLLDFFEPQALAIAQGSDTLSFSREDVVLLGGPWEGKVDGQVEFVGILFIDRVVDMTRPFTILYDLRPGLSLFSTEHSVAPSMLALTREPAAPEADSAPASSAVDTEPVVPDELVASGGTVAEPPVSRDPAGGAGNAVMVPEPTPTPEERGITPDEALAERDPVTLDFAVVEEETVLARTLARTSWSRVAGLVILLGLVTNAFFAKKAMLRWVALSGTLVYLGFIDGGFLSVSHITAGIWVGPSVYLGDLPLLLLLVFTIVTTLIWGRVFCGFLCPFGALQDVIDRFVPRRLQRPLPQDIHDRALYVKYGVLAIIVLPALAGSHVSLYQYFEPFATVFYRSPSLLLWTIAGTFLAASVVIPRFYCRYACPLGAALGVLSLISLKRIRRVEQCDFCKVCEQKCPTGAIRGSEIDFKECVRCNVCEIQLIERSGVCRHEIEDVRPRLVQLMVGTPAGAADGR